jgi:hypothetical protein
MAKFCLFPQFVRILGILAILNLSAVPQSGMSHRQFTVAYETVPLDLLISTPKTLRLLLIHKIRESRLQLLLFNWTSILLALLAAGIGGFSFMPMFLAAGVIAEGVFLFLLMLCIDAGDILLDFAMEDERFFELATRCHALSIFEDPLPSVD